jgi:ABC-2 type transport system ATP-binding protein
MLALDIQNLRKTYAGGVEALKGVSLGVKQGEFLGLLGPNGAGKSTIIGILNSLVVKSSGSVKVFGYDLDSDISSLKSCIGTVPQEFNFSIFEKVRSIVENQGGYFGMPYNLAKERAEEYLKKLQLWGKRNSISRSLSGGMKRRLMIARALVHRPRILILDEPTAGVDIEIRRGMWDFLKELNQSGTTIILTTHYLEEAEYLCDRIAIINEGKIIEDANKKELIDKLDQQSFIFELADDIQAYKDGQHFYFCDDFQCTAVDSRTVQVDLTGEQTLSDVFTYFAQQGWKVTGMRNKVNRLEELFVRLTSSSDEANI